MSTAKAPAAPSGRICEKQWLSWLRLAVIPHLSGVWSLDVLAHLSGDWSLDVLAHLSGVWSLDVLAHLSVSGV